MKVALLLLSAFSSLVSSHSWLACSKYDTTKNSSRITFDAPSCLGYPRNYGAQCDGKGFGNDCTPEYFASWHGPVCHQQLAAGNYGQFYSANFPMARYTPGERICMAWPSKNHVAAFRPDVGCYSSGNRDKGFKIYISAANPQADPTMAQLESLRVVKDFGIAGEVDNSHTGFQNCPGYCDSQNHDTVLCWNCFNIPNDLQAGSVYTLFWVWKFNEDTYINCADATILAAPTPSSAATPTPTSAAAANPSSAGGNPPAGNSNGNGNGNSNGATDSQDTVSGASTLFAGLAILMQLF